jgi:predicted transglutaminase-like cysteine proteinase
VGSATIKTNLGEGQYTVELTKSQAAITAQKTSLTTRKTEIEAAIAAKEIELAALNVTMNEKYEALKTAVGDYAVADPPTKALRKAVTDAQKAYITAQSNCNKKQTEINLLGLELASVNKRLAEIETALTVESRTVWCADYSTALTGSVGTIEINGEAGRINIVPEGKSGIGLLQHPLAMTPSGVFYNWALLPAWQKWKPTYRVGIIDSIDYENDLADVGIPDQFSEGLAINQGGTSWSYEYTDEAISGWENFAERYSDFALVTNTSDTDIAYSSSLMADIDNINKQVNRTCNYMKDTGDQWNIMSDYGSGDCEDFALTKAKRLLDLGYPASALHLEIGYAQNGQGHAWLVVQTTSGDYILDVNYQSPMQSGSVPFTDRRRQTGMEWKVSGVKLTNVPVDYMDSGATVFKAGDHVVVQFQGQSWGLPKVVGFESNPKPPATDFYVHYFQFNPTADSYFNGYKFGSDGKTVTHTTMDIEGYRRFDGLNMVSGITLHPKKKCHYLWVNEFPTGMFVVERHDETLEEIAIHRVKENGLPVAALDSYHTSRYSRRGEIELLMAVSRTEFGEGIVYIVDGNFNTVSTGYNHGGYGFDIVSGNDYLYGYYYDDGPWDDWPLIVYNKGRAFIKFHPAPPPEYTRSAWMDGVKYIENTDKIMYGIHGTQLVYEDGEWRVYVKSEIRLASSDDINDYVTIWDRESRPYRYAVYDFVLLGYVEAWKGYCFAEYFSPDYSRKLYVINESGSILHQIDLPNNDGGYSYAHYYNSGSRLPKLAEP